MSEQAALPKLTLRPVSFGPLPLPTRFLLAPLAGHTNLAFRMAVRQLGGLGLATTDLINARALLQGSRKTQDPGRLAVTRSG